MARQRGRFRAATVTSAVLHGALLVGAWVAAGSARPAPQMQVFQVDMVSLPPNLAGPALSEAPSPAPAAAPQPAADVAEPAVEAAVELAAAEAPSPPEPTPAPPAPPTPKPAPKPEPPKPTPPKSEPPKRAEAKPAAPAPAAPPKQTETRPTPSKPAAQTPPAGAQPVASSSGGEGVSVRSAGSVCPSPEYCTNITKQVKRYFRRPPETTDERADVCFHITRSGAVDDIDVQRLRGGMVFKLALIEAVEQAGRRSEFGALPRNSASDGLDVCVEVSPAT